MATLSFPARKFKYYDFYTSFIKSVFEVGGGDVVIDDTLQYIVPAAFYIKINNKLAFVDLSDFEDGLNRILTKTGWKVTTEWYKPEDLGVPVFKRTMRVGVDYPDNVFAFGPFYVSNNINANDLYILTNTGYIYNSKATKILHTNRVWGGALHTRKLAYSKIQQDFDFDTRRLSIPAHYQRHSELAASLNISGAHYHSQDIGAPESMFLGVPVISNDFDIHLPFSTQLNKNEHYIHVYDDYSNINECLQYIYDHPHTVEDISFNAYDLMKNTCSPTALVAWYTEVVEEYYG